jgi:hypothetical protein
VKEAPREVGLMRVVTPRKRVLKNSRTELGFLERVLKFEEGMKTVQVKEPSCVALVRWS